MPPDKPRSCRFSRQKAKKLHKKFAVSKRMPKFAPRSVKVPLDDKAARLGATVLTFLATNDMYIKKQKTA